MSINTVQKYDVTIYRLMLLNTSGKLQKQYAYNTMYYTSNIMATDLFLV